MAKTLHIGDAFPELTVKTTLGSMNLPDDFAGKWFVLFSHPADFSPVCTTEYVAFQKRYSELQKMGAELIGLSLDQVYSHVVWLNWIKENLEIEIEFPVIADDYGGISSVLGLIHAAKGTNTVRAVFIVDAKGIIRAMLFYPHELGRNIDEILRMVRSLMLADEEEVHIPEGWPTNEIIEDSVVIPPAATFEEAKANLEEYEDHYDWWFCYRKL